MRKPNIGLSDALVAKVSLILESVVPLFIKISSGFAEFISSGVAHALRYLTDEPVLLILTVCVELLKYEVIENICHGFSVNKLDIGVMFSLLVICAVVLHLPTIISCE